MPYVPPRYRNMGGAPSIAPLASPEPQPELDAPTIADEPIGDTSKVERRPIIRKSSRIKAQMGSPPVSMRDYTPDLDALDELLG